MTLLFTTLSTEIWSHCDKKQKLWLCCEQIPYPHSELAHWRKVVKLLLLDAEVLGEGEAV